jgi:hypothetical protein
MRGLEVQLDAMTGTFNTQNVANTLWAYIAMGREPGAGLMRAFEGLAEALAGTFNTQDVANTLCRLVYSSFFSIWVKDCDGCTFCCSS